MEQRETRRTLRKAAIRDAVRVPEHREPSVHLRVVWMNYSDVFDSEQEFLAEVEFTQKIGNSNVRYYPSEGIDTRV